MAAGTARGSTAAWKGLAPRVLTAAMLLDSNILIYAAEPEGAFLSNWVENPAACLASVSRVETLGFPRWHLLDEPRRIRLTSLVDALVELALDERITNPAIELRRQRKMSLADSIIAGTALVYQIPLVTRNSIDFVHIPRLAIIDPFLDPKSATSPTAPPS